MTSETLSRTGSRVAAISRALIRVRDALSDGEPGQAGPGGESEVEGKRSGRSLVSMVLTSQAHRRCTPRTNRRIPAIPAGNIDGRLVHVSAVDTGPRRSGSGVLGGTARRLRHRSTPAPCPLRRGPEAMVRRLLRPAPAPSRSTPRGSGSTGQWLCVLHEGPTYPQYPQPSSSSTPPSCSASRRHRGPRS